MGSLEKRIVEVLRSSLNPYVIVLFGSTAQGRSREESDLDIGFLSEDIHNSYDLFLVAQQLAGEMNQDVDLVDLATASTVFQAQVVSTGKLIYCSDEKRRMEFEMKVLKIYAKLNEERKVVIDSIKESGTVYGEGCNPK